MSEGVNQRLVRQFRMPGLPLVLVTTDVLQQGGDLHTFCRRIAHYGIAWTPSAIEQRTGRVDRIGGLVQRRLDGSPELPPAEDLIQVYYPHLRDTVELLQVRRVLRRLNRFLRFIHRGESAAGTDGRAIDAARALLDELEDMPPIQGELESAFPIEPRSGWLEGARRRRRSFFSPHGSSVRQELIDDALARLLVFPHAGLDLLNRDRWSNKTKLSCFYAGRHPAVVSQGDRLAHLERDQESTVRSDLERLRPDCTGVRFGRSGSGGSRRLVVALLPVLILSAGRVPVAVLGYVTFDDFAAFCTTTFLTGDFRSMGCFTYSSCRAT